MKRSMIAHSCDVEKPGEQPERKPSFSVQGVLVGVKNLLGLILLSEKRTFANPPSPQRRMPGEICNRATTWDAMARERGGRRKKSSL